MATTSNFGWTTPDDTDLVKDGAAAIRTLGSAIDTSLVDLKGGTTGQVLSKTSDTDMDFTWVAQDDTDAIQSSIIAAKGDLIVGTANDTAGILSVGTDGYTLVADSSVSPQGLKWAVDPVADVITTAGDLLYGSAADTVARLGIGTAGQVLQVNSGATAPEWVAAGAPSQDFALINSGGTALTGSGTTTINVSGKNQLFIRVTAASAVGAYCVLNIRFNSDSGANYGYIGFEDSSGSFAMTQGTADTELAMGQGGNNASNNIAANILVSGANATGYKPISYASIGSGTGSVERIANAWYSGSSAITSVNIISSGQNFDAGTVFVYGA